MNKPNPTINIVFAYSKKWGTIPFRVWAVDASEEYQAWLNDFIAEEPGELDRDIRGFGSKPDGVYHFKGEVRTSTDYETGYSDDVWFAGKTELLYEPEMLNDEMHLPSV